MKFSVGALVLMAWSLGVSPAVAQAPPPEPKPIIVLDENNRLNIAPTLDVTFDGSVGIGTRAPALKLDVQGQLNAASGICIAGDCRTTWTQTGSLWSASGSNVLYNAGNVGIGTTAPAFRFDVQGGQVNASGGLCISGDCRTAWSQIGSSQWTTTGSGLGYAGGNVGIGTSIPQGCSTWSAVTTTAVCA